MEYVAPSRLIATPGLHSFAIGIADASGTLLTPWAAAVLRNRLTRWIETREAAVASRRGQPAHESVPEGFSAQGAAEAAASLSADSEAPERPVCPHCGPGTTTGMRRGKPYCFRKAEGAARQGCGQYFDSECVRKSDTDSAAPTECLCGGPEGHVPGGILCRRQT